MSKSQDKLNLAIEALQQISNGLTTQVDRVEFLTKQLARETLVEIQNDHDCACGKSFGTWQSLRSHRSSCKKWKQASAAVEKYGK